MISLDSVSGMRDFPPITMAKRRYLFNTMSEIARLHDFQEYNGPVVESTNLYRRKGGDDVVNEMFTFTCDGQDLCLRPEMTPTLARIIMSMRIENPPWKWFSISQFFRYETATKDRKREHDQLNCDIIGCESVNAELELFSLIVDLLEKLGLGSKDIVLCVSHRMVLQNWLEARGITQEFERIFNIVDKLKKITQDDLSAKLLEISGFTPPIVDDLLAFVQIRDIDELQRVMPNNKSVRDLCQLFESAKMAGISDWLSLDMTIVRGLSYYTGIVFEGFSKTTTIKRSLCGGGRYNTLMTTLGSKKSQPMVGFGMGDVVITEILEELGLMTPPSLAPKYCIVPFDKDMYGPACQIARQIRKRGFATDLYMKEQYKTGKLFAYADKKNAAYTLLIAPREYADGKMVIKDMNKSKDDPQKQITIDIADFIKYLS